MFSTCLLDRYFRSYLASVFFYFNLIFYIDTVDIIPFFTTKSIIEILTFFFGAYIFCVNFATSDKIYIFMAFFEKAYLHLNLFFEIGILISFHLVQIGSPSGSCRFHCAWHFQRQRNLHWCLEPFGRTLAWPFQPESSKLSATHGILPVVNQYPYFSIVRAGIDEWQRCFKDLLIAPCHIANRHLPSGQVSFMEAPAMRFIIILNINAVLPTWKEFSAAHMCSIRQWLAPNSEP